MRSRDYGGSASAFWRGRDVSDESSGLDHLLSYIDEQLEQLMSLSQLPRDEFERSETLRLVAEPRLETTAQACVDVAHRILAMHDRSATSIDLPGTCVSGSDLGTSAAAGCGFRIE